MKQKSPKRKYSGDNITLTKKPYSASGLLIILACFISIASFTMYFHEMWRDEYQAWQISFFSESIRDLFANIHFEGHPAGWFLILYFLSGISSDPVIMQIVHLVISAAGVFLILKYSPFSLYEKILLVAGYFFIYEYTVISRNYSISIILIVILCIQLGRLKINSWITGIALFLLCNTNLYGGILAAVFTFFLMLRVFDRQTDKNHAMGFLFPVSMAVIGLILLYIQIRPASLVHANDYYKWKGGISFDRFVETGDKFFNVLFALPEIKIDHSFGQNIFSGFSALKFLAAGIVLSVAGWNFRRNRKILAMFIAGILTLFVVLYLNEHTSLRHEGFIFIFFICTIWMFRSASTSTQCTRSFKRMFMFILIAQAVGGLTAVAKDILYPFSNLKDAAQFIVRNNFGKYDISGMADYIVSPISAFTRKQIFVPETGKEIYFITWDDSRIENDKNLYSLIRRADSLETNSKEQCLIVFTQALRNTNGEIIRSSPVSGNSSLRLIKSFDKPNIVGDENYYIYELTTP